VKLITLNVDPNELFHALKEAVSDDIDEEEVLKRYSVHLPADEHALDPTSLVEARDQTRSFVISELIRHSNTF
jgi:hypothetical protein